MKKLDIFKHKDIPLYVVDMPYYLNDSMRIYYTRIPWGEYKRIRFAERVESIPPWELKTKIFRDYTVRDPGWTEMEINTLPAGIVDTVADLIMHVSDSGIIPDKNGNIDTDAFTYRLNMYRNIARTNVEYQMYTIICLVFRAYTFESLDKLPFDRISSLFASAERYLLDNGILKETLQIYNPNDKKKDKKQNKEQKEVTTNAKPGTEEASFLQELLRMKEKAEEIKEESIEPKKEVPPPPPKPAPKPEAKPEPKVQKPQRPPEYIPPKDKVVVSNGVAVQVPGITMGSSLGGFSPEDFSAPLMTDDEALAMQMEMGIMPAGYDLYLARLESEKEQKAQEDKNKPMKKKFKRK